MLGNQETQTYNTSLAEATGQSTRGSNMEPTKQKIHNSQGKNDLLPYLYVLSGFLWHPDKVKDQIFEDKAQIVEPKNVRSELGP